MSKKYKNICNINAKERYKRTVYSIIFFLITIYVWYILLVNKFGGWNKFVLAVPLYFAFLTIYEAVTGWCVMKDKANKRSVLIHVLSIASSIAVSVTLVFV